MASNFDVYVRRNTWLYCLDPRVKLGFVVVASAMTFLWPSPFVALAVAAASVALLLIAGVGGDRVWRFLRGLLPLLLVVLALTTLFSGGAGPAWFTLGPLRVTPAGFQQAALLATRLLSLGLVFFFWLSTTDQGEMVRGFVALRLPYEWGLTLALALRYLPILGGLMEQVREAQEARGLDLAQQRFMARLRAYGPILVAVIIGALRHGERLGWALEARALGDSARRTEYRPLKMRRDDGVALALLSLILLGAIVLRLL